MQLQRLHAQQVARGFEVSRHNHSREFEMAVLEQKATVVAAPGPQRATAPPRSRLSAPAPVRVVPQTRRTGLLQCLVISTSAQRREMLERAADEAGWDTIACRDADAGWAAVKRQRFQLAIVDIDHVMSPAALKQFSEEVADMEDTLLMLCGNEGEALEEIWARQLGAWLYLPGVTEGSDVKSLCEQARPVAEKLMGFSGPLNY